MTTQSTVVAGPTALDDDALVVRRLRPLPGSRALAGGFLVAVAVVGTFVTVTGAGRDARVPVVVARDDLALGARITAGDLALARVDVPPYMRARAFRSPDALVGAVVIGPVARGELVQHSDVLRGDDGAPPGREVSFPVEAARAVDGTLHRGEHVDVLVTYGTGESATTATVVRAARVVRVRAPGGVLADDRTLVVTVRVVTADDAIALAHAANAGEVTVVRTGAA